MTKVFLLLFGILVVASSCQKEISVELPNSGHDTTIIDDPPPVNPSDTLNYFPTKKDTYLKYIIKSSAAPDTIFTLVATGQQETKDGIAYEIWKEPVGGQTVDLAKKDHKYYNRIQVIDPTTEQLVDVSYIYLIDTASVGDQWVTEAGLAGQFVLSVPTAVIDKNATVQVQGKTYQHVFHTQLDMVYTIPGVGSFLLITYHYYIARDIGVIKIDAFSYDEFGGISRTDNEELLEYFIK